MTASRMLGHVRHSCVSVPLTTLADIGTIPFLFSRVFPNPDKGYLAESSKMTSRRPSLPRLEGQHNDALSS
jgi:hypothetical protein